MYQQTLLSPCLLGAPCPTCVLHAPCQAGYLCGICRRGDLHQCERESPAPPAFYITIRDAVRMVQCGQAVFINKNNALRLTYAGTIHLRDLSARADARVIVQYTAGYDPARVAIDWGWSMPPEVAGLIPGQAGNPAVFRYY